MSRYKIKVKVEKVERVICKIYDLGYEFKGLGIEETCGFMRKGNYKHIWVYVDREDGSIKWGTWEVTTRGHKKVKLKELPFRDKGKGGK